MSNHIHLIITTKNDDGNISDIIRDFKKYTSKLIAKSIETIGESRREWLLNVMSKEAKRIGRATNYKLWKDDNHAICIFSPRGCSPSHPYKLPNQKAPVWSSTNGS